MDKYVMRGCVVEIVVDGERHPLANAAQVLNRLTQSEATLKAKVAELEDAINKALFRLDADDSYREPVHRVLSRALNRGLSE